MPSTVFSQGGQEFPGQRVYTLHLGLALAHRSGACSAEAHEERRGLRARAPATLLPAAVDGGLDIQRASQDECAHAGRAGDLVSREGDHGGLADHRRQVKPRCGLHRVGVKRNVPFGRDGGEFGDGLERAGLVVGGHDRHDARLGPQRGGERVRQDPPLVVDREGRDLHTQRCQ